MTTPEAYNLDPRAEELHETVPASELEREWADVDADYHDIIDSEIETDSSTAQESAEGADSDKR